MSTKAVTKAPAGPVAITKTGSIIVDAAKGVDKLVQRVVQQSLQGALSSAKALQALDNFCISNCVRAADASGLLAELVQMHAGLTLLFFATAKAQQRPVTKAVVRACAPEVNAAVAKFVKRVRMITKKDTAKLHDDLTKAIEDDVEDGAGAIVRA